MKIQLSDKVYLESDSMQFIIRKYTGHTDEKTHKEIYNNLSYFSSFKSALKHIIKMDLLDDNNLLNLLDIRWKLDQIEKKIDEVVWEVKP